MKICMHLCVCGSQAERANQHANGVKVMTLFYCHRILNGGINLGLQTCSYVTYSRVYFPFLESDPPSHVQMSFTVLCLANFSLWSFLNSCSALICRWNPRFFSERGGISAGVLSAAFPCLRAAVGVGRVLFFPPFGVERTLCSAGAEEDGTCSR